MNVTLLRSKKGLDVVDHCRAVLKDWRMGFTLKGMPCVEPSWANATRSPGAELHGVAFKISLSDAAKLSAQERSYDQIDVDLELGDGRRVKGYLYSARPDRLQAETPPSARYLRVLVDGAREAGLPADYVARLEATPTYRASPATLLARSSLPPPDALPRMTVEALRDAAAGRPEIAHVAVLGYIFQLRADQVSFSAHKQRDITARAQRQWRGLPLDENDDMGRPPFPDPAVMEAGEREFVNNWLDHYLDKAGAAGAVAFVAE